MTAAQFEDRCASCGERIHVGDPIRSSEDGSWAPFTPRVVSSAVLAPQRPAERLETIGHLDFHHEQACEVIESDQKCARTPITHRFIPEGDPCGCTEPFLACRPHAEELDDGAPLGCWCRECGAEVEFRVVPL